MQTTSVIDKLATLPKRASGLITQQHLSSNRRADSATRFGGEARHCGVPRASAASEGEAGEAEPMARGPADVTSVSQTTVTGMPTP